jgi:NTP pyrophosphatase (non-canonical NTP hydrolase)
MGTMPTLADLTRQVIAFRDERDWKQFHNPKDVAISLSLEASELLELFQWQREADIPALLESRAPEIGDELADVLYWTLLMAHDLGIDLNAALSSKLEQNALKYPVARSRGSSAKYTELD